MADLNLNLVSQSLAQMLLGVDVVDVVVQSFIPEIEGIEEFKSTAAEADLLACAQARAVVIRHAFLQADSCYLVLLLHQKSLCESILFRPIF